jgi:hypothetical protein
MARLRYNAKRLRLSTKRLRFTSSVSADVAITVNRAASPIRASTDRYHIGVTFTQDTFPGGAVSSAVANVKAKLVDLDLDYINLHNHHFGLNGPKTNADHDAGLTYATRNSWTGWTAWDARLQECRDCAGASTEYIITLLPPGWCKMDGGSKTNTASDPLGEGRSWDGINNDSESRHTDAHRTDMIDMAKAIALRHSDVVAFAVINEQKGNYMPPNESTNFGAEIADDGLSSIHNYFEQERYQEGLRTALDAIGKTGVEVIGPYLVVEGGAHELLATTYAGIGFPQPSTVASVGGNTFKTYNPDTKLPFASGSRTKTYIEQWFSRASSASRSNWYALDWKVFGGDNDPNNWEVLYPWRWYMLEGVREALVRAKTMAGYTPSDRIYGAETYWRKVQDDINVPSDAEQGAMAAELLRIELEEGVHTHLRWAPEQGDIKPNRCNLFTSTTVALGSGGGVPHPAYDTYKLFCDHFRSVNVFAASSSDMHVVSAVSNPTHTLLINHTGSTKTVSINGAAAVTLAAYEVKLVTA